MAKYHLRKRPDGTYLVYSQLGEKGAVRYLAHDKGVKKQDLPAAVARQATLAKKVRDSRQLVQDSAGEHRSTQ